MRYTLAENAASSLHIALKHFKVFYYNSDKLPQSMLDENIKISLTFLENAIELLIKTILIASDETSIYVEPNSKAIRKAKSQNISNMSLHNILIRKGNIKTITYTEALEKYNSKFHKSKKLYNILHTLGERRNQITHFGIELLKYDEILILFFNVFDVIYNYLYPQLIELEDIGEYFTSDEFLVNTVHGIKNLFDEDFVYNNIVDFLDELLGDCREYFCSIRANNPDTKICVFKGLFQSAINDKKFQSLCNYYKIKVDFSMCKFNDNYYSIDFKINENELGHFYSEYSPYYNATVFSDDAGYILFIILHEKDEMYLYYKPAVYSSYDEPEDEERWISDMENGYCERVKLSKRNILRIFETKFKAF